jgi:hypothetical protein
MVARAQTSGSGTDITSFELRRGSDALELSAVMSLELNAAVQGALLKGLPIFFITEAEVFRERWYWLDRRVGGAQRPMRLVYQPLSRRWRLSSGSSESAAALAQSFDTLEEALSVIRRVSDWHVVDLAELEPGARYRVEFRFKLDTTQLPRPLQIGTLGESEWVLGVNMTRRFQPESLR